MEIRTIIIMQQRHDFSYQTMLVKCLGPCQVDAWNLGMGRTPTNNKMAKIFNKLFLVPIFLMFLLLGPIKLGGRITIPIGVVT